MSFDGSIGGLTGFGGSFGFDAEGRLVEGVSGPSVGILDLQSAFQGFGEFGGGLGDFGGGFGVDISVGDPPSSEEIAAAIQREIDAERERERDIPARTTGEERRSPQGQVIPGLPPIGDPITLDEAARLAQIFGVSISTICETEDCRADTQTLTQPPREEPVPPGGEQGCPPCALPFPIDLSLVTRLAIELGLEFPLDVTAFVTFLNRLSGLPGVGSPRPTPGFMDAAALPGCSATFFQPERCCCRVCVQQSSCCGGGCGCGGSCCG